MSVEATIADDPVELHELIPESGELAADEALDRFLRWVDGQGLVPYPHQEEALLELFAGRHVILNTPTGSGKTLVATALLFRALCLGRRAYYTAPVKALVNEKFFALCRDLGPENVGMLTGDASINHDAPVICCTAEILSNQVLRWGDAGAPDDVVMDEFHFYGDRDRGAAWQIPLIALPDTTFLLMSATLGDMSRIVERLEVDTGRKVAWIQSAERPVPLDYAWRETPLHETVEELIEDGRVPAYIVNFTRRECNEQAQQLTSVTVATREERKQIGRRVGRADMSTPFGKGFRRILRHGIGIHHAGMLPRYRLLVEQLAQEGLLKIICGTDTLGVGVNIPIRTVVFSKLAKYDGQKVRILSARQFHQIAGRAGRKGFDEQGSVVGQAPEHIIENRKLRQKRKRAERKGKKGPSGKFKRPEKGEVTWGRSTFEQLIDRPPEKLRSRFQVTHGMLINVLQRARDDASEEAPPGADRSAITEDPSGGYGFLVDLIVRNHDRTRRKKRQLVRAATLFRALRGAGIVRVEHDDARGRSMVRVSEELQEDFSLHQTLSLWLVESVAMLDPYDEDHALNIVSLAEAALENPWPIVRAQEWKRKGELVQELKSQRVPYEERMRRLDEVSHPKPLADFIHGTLNIFMEDHPWVTHDDVNPKSIAREMFEGYFSFENYVRRYDLHRDEGILLRYLGQAWRTLSQNIPEPFQTEAFLEIVYYLRVMLEQVDSSLLAEWDRLRALQDEYEDVDLGVEIPTIDLVEDAAARGARIRAELLMLVQHLALGEFDAAADALADAGDDGDRWDGAKLEMALEPFAEQHGAIVFDHAARRKRFTRVRQVGPRRWEVSQTLVAQDGPTAWHVLGEVDLSGRPDPHGGLIRMIDVTTVA